MTSSREVAEISFEVAPISVVVAATSLVVACCCLEVAAISVTEEFTTIAAFCTWLVSVQRWVTICEKAAASVPISSVPSASISWERSPCTAVAWAASESRRRRPVMLRETSQASSPASSSVPALSAIARRRRCSKKVEALLDQMVEFGRRGLRELGQGIGRVIDGGDEGGAVHVLAARRDLVRKRQHGARWLS